MKYVILHDNPHNKNQVKLKGIIVLQWEKYKPALIYNAFTALVW